MSRGEVGRGGSRGFGTTLRLLPLLLPAEGGEVEEVVRATGGLQAPSVLRVGVEHAAIDLQEAAPAWHVVGLFGGLHALMAHRCVLVEGAEVVLVKAAGSVDRDREV